MEKYIPLDALVAEIDRREIGYNVDCKHSVEYDTTRKILNIIDTLEVKEVDLEKEFEWFLDEAEGVPRMWHSDEQIEWAKDIAKHFFELGLKVAQKGEEV